MKKFLPLILMLFLLPQISIAKSGTVPPPSLTEIICEQRTDSKGHPYWDCFTNQKKKIYVFGTEYVPFENGRIYIQLLSKDQPINNALCLIDLYYPDLTLWFDDAAMLYLNGSEGLYYFDIIIPDKVGVYMTTVKCFYIIDETYDYADNTVVIKGLESGTFQDTWKDDNEYHDVREKQVGGYTLDFYYEFYNVSVPENYIGMTIYWIGRWNDPEEDVCMYIWDWCNSSWIKLKNCITTNTPMVSNYLDTSIWNSSCLVAPSGTVRVKLNDTDPSEKSYFGNLMTDFIDVQMHYLSFGAIESIRGGGELHVSNPRIPSIISEMVEERLIHNHNYCINNTTLKKELLIEKCYFDECYNITRSEIIECKWGCNAEAGECYPPPYERMLVVIGIIALIIILVFLGRRFLW